MHALLEFNLQCFTSFSSHSVQRNRFHENTQNLYHSGCGCDCSFAPGSNNYHSISLEDERKKRYIIHDL